MTEVSGETAVLVVQLRVEAAVVLATGGRAPRPIGNQGGLT